MRPQPLPKSAMGVLACTTPLVLISGGAALAQEPGAECVVGTPAYPTIQSAVDTAACTTIRVPAGTYYENLTIGRNLAIRGAGPQSTVVDATGKDSSVVRINGPASRQVCDPPVVIVTLAGMTITGGTGPSEGQRNGGGIGASPGVKLTVENVVVTGNSAYMNGGGISVPNGRLTIVDSLITRNTAYANNPNTGGGGVRVAGCPSALIVKNSVITDNVSHRFGGGIYSYVATPIVVVPGGPGVPAVSIPGPDGTLVVVGSNVMRNWAAEPFGGGGIYHVRTDFTALDSRVKHNLPDDAKQP